MRQEMDFSGDQEAAVCRIEDWRVRNDRPFMTMGGYAGTGKTSLTSYFASEWGGTEVAALCGKAAQRLREKGVHDARTIHSLIYVPFEDALGKVRYRLRDSLPGVERIIIDEAGMVDHLLMQDLLSFGIPILFVGDHGQLEPIGTNPGLMKSPDVTLEKIHRQAADNPILRLAAAFREGRNVPYWSSKDGRCRILSRGHFQGLVRPGVQIICGYHKTRHQVNAHVREMKGVKKPRPEPGERLTCLQNNKKFGVFNGQQFDCQDVTGGRSRYLDLEVTDDEGKTTILPALKRQFGVNKIADWKDPGVCLFDYGYACTAHASQGSEWPEVLILSEIANSWNPRRWLYTTVTRGRNKVAICM